MQQEDDTENLGRFEQPKHPLTRKLMEELSQDPDVGKIARAAIGNPITDAIRLASAKSQLELDILLKNLDKRRIAAPPSQGATRSSNGRLHD